MPTAAGFRRRDLGGTYFWSNAAYASGKVFAINFDGPMIAVDMATGGPIWSAKMTGQYAFSSPPTALGGQVFVGGAGSGGTLYAVDADTGTIQWTASVENGDKSSPAVSATGVFVSYACNQAYGFRPLDGALLWHHTDQCEGGGGKTVALFDGRVYTRDYFGDLILGSDTGSLLGTFESGPIPAGAAGKLYTVFNGNLSAQAFGTTPPFWTFANGALVTAPIVIGTHVVVGASTGELDVVSAIDGTLEACDRLPLGLEGPDEQNVTGPLTGLAAGGDGLYVPVGTELVAY